jgi:hypothetical protein
MSKISYKINKIVPHRLKCTALTFLEMFSFSGCDGTLTYKFTIDLTSKIGRHTSSLCNEARHQTGLVKETHFTYISSTQTHGLPKIQKRVVPLWHTVNHTASTMHGLAKYLTGFVRPSAGQSEHHIKNCKIFIKKVTWVFKRYFSKFTHGLTVC